MRSEEEKEQSKDKIAQKPQPGLDKESVHKLIELTRNQTIKRMHLWATILGIIVGAFFAVSGFVITILGFTGSIEWFFKAGNFTSKLGNAGPGVFFALLGMLILWRYKPRSTERLEIESSSLSGSRGSSGSGGSSGLAGSGRRFKLKIDTRLWHHRPPRDKY